MKDSIKAVIVDLYRTSPCDKYGQLQVFTISEVIDPKDEEQVSLLSELVSINTYGGSIGIYKGFSPWYSFKDKDLEEKCKAAFQLNESRNNMNNW